MEQESVGIGDSSIGFSEFDLRELVFEKVLATALELELSDDRILDILGFTTEFLSGSFDWEATDRYDLRMQNCVAYMFPEGSQDPLFEFMLLKRRERMDEIDRLFSRMESDGPKDSAGAVANPYIRRFDRDVR